MEPLVELVDQSDKDLDTTANCPAISGLTYLPDFLAEEEVDGLLEAVEASLASGAVASSGRPVVMGPGVHFHGFQAPGRHRAAGRGRGWWRAQGGERSSCPWCGGRDSTSGSWAVPTACNKLLERLQERGLLPEGYYFDQAILNRYSEDSSSIPPHVDRAQFDDVIVGFSIGAPAAMYFTPAVMKEREVESHQLTVTEGSAYVMAGEARWKWQHSVQLLPMPFRSCGSGPERLASDCRISVTFRRLRGRVGLPGRAPVCGEPLWRCACLHARKAGG